MKIQRYLARNVNLLNVLLVTVVVVIAVRILFPLTHATARYVLPRVMLKATEEKEKPVDKLGSLMPSDYTVIAETNLFHPDRVIPVDKKTAEVPKPDLILYGTTVSDGLELAFVEDKKNPKSTPGRGTRQTVLKKGEAVGGYTVAEIKTDRIELVRGDDRITVTLTDSVKKRESTMGQMPAPVAGTAARTQPGGVNPYTPSTDAFAPTRVPQARGQMPGAMAPDQAPGAVSPQPLQRGTAPGGPASRFPSGMLPGQQNTK